MLDQAATRSGGQWPEALFVLAKGLRTLAVFSAWGYISSYQLPLAVYLFVLLLGSAAYFLIVQRPWKGQKRVRWIRVVKYTLLYLINLVCWHLGLKYYGPLRTILVADYGDVLLSPLLRRRSNQPGAKFQGAVLVLISYILLLYTYSPEQGPVPSSEVEGSAGLFGLPDRVVGMLAILITIALNVVRKKYYKGLSVQLGSTKRLFSLSVSLGAAFLSPFATYSYFTMGAVSFSSLGFLFSMACIILFFVVVDYYVDTGRATERPQTANKATKMGIIISAVIAFSLEWWYSSSSFFGASSLLGMFFFAVLLLGIQMRFTAGVGSSASDVLPLYGSAVSKGESLSLGKWIYSFLKTTLKEILKNSDSRNIFLFLVLNLLFMFVEMLYGYWTNSLGLISDGFHMLFDCIALLIGLGASVISKWKANETLTYGYGRVEVLSGFINGVFLIFVAFFVLMESVERFLDPPKIETEKLLLVSFLGLLVNMVGIFAFSHGHSHGGHGHSHGGHGHGEKKHGHVEKKHSHSHGEKKHGHSHSHGEKKKHKDKKHGHSHSHGEKHKHHEHDDHHDHHEHDDHHDHHDNCEHDHDHDHDHDHHDHDHHDHHDHDHGHSHEQSQSHRRRQSGNSIKSSGESGKDPYVTVHLHDLEGELEQEPPKSHGWCRCFSGWGANLSGIGLHVFADFLGSVSVIISSSLIMLMDWHIADPICSFCISIMIFVSVIPLFQECIASLSQRIPEPLQPVVDGILQHIRGMEEVEDIREFHIWEHSSTVVVGTAILVIHEEADEQAVREAVAPLFQEHCQYFTLQITKKRFYELEGDLQKRSYGQPFSFTPFTGSNEVVKPSSGGFGGMGGVSSYGQEGFTPTSSPSNLITVVNNTL